MNRRAWVRTSENTMHRQTSWKAAFQALFTRLYWVHSLTCMHFGALVYCSCMHLYALWDIKKAPLCTAELAKTQMCCEPAEQLREADL